MYKIMRLVIGIAAAVVLIVVSIVLIAGMIFDRKVEREVAALLNDEGKGTETIGENELDRFPPCVQKWVENSGVVGKEKIRTVRLRQKGSMRTVPDGPWMPFEAEQYFRVDKPAFIWKASVHVAPLFHLVARDKYEDGRGNMLIKLLSLITVADSRGQEIDQGTMLRYLAETSWFPTAAVSKYIRWETLDSTSARATMSYNGITASGIFRFNAQRDFVSFEALRYGEFDGKYVLAPWLIRARDYRSFEGVRIACSSDVTWKLGSGDFTWLTLELTELEFNKPGAY